MGQLTEDDGLKGGLAEGDNSFWPRFPDGEVEKVTFTNRFVSEIDDDEGDISDSFFYLLMIQGFFTGLTVGKLGGGGFKSGIKHSFALMLIGFVVSTGAGIILGTPATAPTP